MDMSDFVTVAMSASTITSMRWSVKDGDTGTMICPDCNAVADCVVKDKRITATCRECDWKRITAK